MARHCLVVAVAVLLSWPAHAGLKVTGPSSSAANMYDGQIGALMEKYKVPCGAIAVTRHGKLVVARGYATDALKNEDTPQPTSLFRIASVSKPITAVTIYHLIEQGKLKLDQPVLPILQQLQPKGGPSDKRWAKVTIRMLLQHAGGWDRDTSKDPMFLPYDIATAMKTKPPADAQTIVRYMFTKPLDFDPGTKMVYSNFGYCVLGRVIEAVTGKSYIDYVTSDVLEPMGIFRMALGHTRVEDRLPTEVSYAMPAGTALLPSVFPEVKEKVPAPYGGFHLEAMDAHGGWLASPVDLVRFAVHTEHHRWRGRQTGTPTTPASYGFLSAESIAAMTARPGPPVSGPTGTYYACGWMVVPVMSGPGGVNWWHNGGFAGTTSMLVRTSDDYCWSFVFNESPPGALFNEADQAMWTALNIVLAWPPADQWPAEDLFATIDLVGRRANPFRPGHGSH